MAQKKFLSSFGASVLIFLCLVAASTGSPSRLLSLQRIRRAAADSTTEAQEMAVTGSMASSPMPTTMPMTNLPSSASSPAPSSMMESGHESHKVDCTGDISAAKKTCPDNSTCPVDDDNIEKCCHCLNTCCMMGSSEEGGMSTGKPGKDIGSRVKDAVNSAEGWIKNAGQNIKNSWNKAKDSISNAASDVSDKVKKGINSVSNRVRNATSGGSNSSTNANCKDGKCTTDMSTGSEGSTEGSSESTPVPGMQKSKRDLSGRTNYSPYHSAYSGIYDSRYPGSYSIGSRDSDSSDSREYSWSKTTTHTTGNSNNNNNRRYRRAVNKSNSTSSPPPLSTSEKSPEKSGRSRRAAGGGEIAFTENPSQMSENCTGRMSMPSNGRQRRDAPSNGNSRDTSTKSSGQSSSSPSSMSNGSTSGSSRKTRAAVSTSTEKVQMNVTTVTTPNSNSSSRRNRRETKSSQSKNSSKDGSSSDSTAETSTEESDEDDEDSDEESSKDHGSSHGGHYKGTKDDSNYSISVKFLGPRGSNETRYSYTTGKSSDRDHGHGHEHEQDRQHRFDERDSGSGGGNRGHEEYYQSHIESSGKVHMTSQDSNEDSESTMEHPPLMYPDGKGGGVLSGPGQGSGGGNAGQSHGASQHMDDHHSQDHGHGGGGGSYFGGRQSHDFTNRENIRSVQSSSSRDFEPFSSSSSGIDVAYYPVLRPDSGISPQSGMFRTGQSRNYDTNYHQNRHSSQHDHHQFQGGDDSYGWNVNSHHGGSGNSNNNGEGMGDGSNYDSQSYYDGNSGTGSNSNWDSSGNNEGNSYSSGSNRGSTSTSSSTDSNGMAYGKPGECKPLGNGVHCLNLHPDTSQCLYDKDCSGPKKCCFYGCPPNKNVGTCELPNDGYSMMGHHHNHDQGY